MLLSGTLPDGATIDTAQDGEWRSASLFAARAQRMVGDSANQLLVTPAAKAKDKPQASADPLTPPRGALFIPLSGKTAAP